MKKLLFVFSVITAVFALNLPNMAFAAEALPEIAPVEDVAPPALDATTDATTAPEAAK